MNKKIEMFLGVAYSIVSVIFMAILPWQANRVEFCSVFPEKRKNFHS